MLDHCNADHSTADNCDSNYWYADHSGADYCCQTTADCSADHRNEATGCADNRSADHSQSGVQQ